MQSYKMIWRTQEIVDIMHIYISVTTFAFVNKQQLYFPFAEL